MITIGTKAQGLKVGDEVMLKSELVYWIKEIVYTGITVQVYLSRQGVTSRTWWHIDETVNKVLSS